MKTNELKMKIDLSKVDLVTDCLKVLSNPDRLKILCVLIDCELNVQQIEKTAQVYQPTLSQQLTILRKSKMVSTRREGKQIFYQFSDMRILQIMQTLYGLYCMENMNLD